MNAPRTDSPGNTLSRIFFARLAATLALLVFPLAVAAQAAATSPAHAYPAGPITIVVPLAPGDGGDTTARAMSEDLSRQLNVPVLVSNRPGAGGSIGVQNVIAARKDGATLLFTQNGPLTIRRVLEPHAAAYDPLKELIPLGITGRTPSILVVRKDAPFRNFQEFIAQARKAPGGVRVGTPGTGSAADISVQIVNSLAGVDITAVPYKGASPAVTDVLGGQIEAVILALGAVSAHIKSGALKPLAISSPSPEFPDVPTLSKLGYKQELQGVWFAVFAPAGVAPELTQALISALERTVKNPAIAARLQSLGIIQDWAPPQKLAADIASEYEFVGELTRRLAPRKP